MPEKSQPCIRLSLCIHILAKRSSVEEESQLWNQFSAWIIRLSAPGCIRIAHYRRRKFHLALLWWYIDGYFFTSQFLTSLLSCNKVALITYWSIVTIYYYIYIPAAARSIICILLKPPGEMRWALEKSSSLHLFRQSPSWAQTAAFSVPEANEKSLLYVYIWRK
jgi:hypothetical protein